MSILTAVISFAIGFLIGRYFDEFRDLLEAIRDKEGFKRK